MTVSHENSHQGTKAPRNTKRFIIKWAGEYMIDRRPGRMNRIRAIIPGVLALLFFFVAGAIGDSLFADEAKEHITAELACQEPPHCEDTGELIGSPTCFYKDHFGENEEVWVAVYPKTIGGNLTGKTARIYIVYDKTSDQWIDNSELIDVTGDKSGKDYEVITFNDCESNIISIQAWKKPAIREDGYDVVVDFEPFGRYNKGVDIIDGLKEKGFFVPEYWICLESITLNHDPYGDLSDAINIRKNFNEEVHVPEWKKGEEPYPAAYIKDRSITVKAVFSAAPEVNSAEIKAVGVNGLLGNILTKTIEFNNNCISEPISFNISCPTPDRITSFIQKWKWYYQNVNEYNYPKEYYMGSSKNKIYIMLATPQSPWTTTGQAEPWTEVLEKSCQWANGEIASVAAAKKIAHNLYGGIGGRYSCGGEPMYTGSGEDDFDLVHFVENMPKVGYVNCYDMGKALVIFSNAVGCGLAYRLSEQFGKVNCVKPIGVPSCIKEFTRHAFASIGDRVFDASLKTCKNCDSIDDGELLTNVLWSEYVKKVTKNNSPNFPDIYLFKINHTIKRKDIENACIRRFEDIKSSFDIDTVNTKNGKVISGLDISEKTLPQLSHMLNVWENNLIRIEKIQNDTYFIIHKVWKDKNDRFDIMMIVSPTNEAAIKYLALRYTNTSTKLPRLQLESNIGDVCFVNHATQQSECFSRIDFIRHNVLIMIKADGTIKKEITGIARELDARLFEMDKKTGEKSGRIENNTNITRFCLDKDSIKLGERVPLHLEVENPIGGKLEYLWEISGGGIEYDCSKNLFYYGSKKGKQTITVTVVNEYGLERKAREHCIVN